MPSPTYVAIATVTVGSGGAASIEFSSIPATYTDLCMVVSARSAHNDGYESAKIALNGSNTYSYKRLSGYDTTAASNGSASSQSWWVIGGNSSTYATPNTFTSVQFYFPNYTSSNDKSVSLDFAVEQNGNGGLNLNWLGMVAGLVTLTSAITTITLTTLNAANFMQYSTATLYGIKNSQERKQCQPNSQWTAPPESPQRLN